MTESNQERDAAASDVAVCEALIENPSITGDMMNVTRLASYWIRRCQLMESLVELTKDMLTREMLEGQQIEDKLKAELKDVRDMLRQESLLRQKHDAYYEERVARLESDVEAMAD